jgi:hypothetical protein
MEDRLVLYSQQYETVLLSEVLVDQVDSAIALPETFQGQNCHTAFWNLDQQKSSLEVTNLQVDSPRVLENWIVSIVFDGLGIRHELSILLVQLHVFR